MKKQLLAGAAVLMMSTSTFASAFQLFTYDGASVGDAGAGGAAIADTASTNFANAAGLTRLKNPQIVVSADQIWTKNDFTGTATTSTTPGIPPYIQSGSVSSHSTNLIPSFHYGSPINDRWAFGFSVTTPFYLETDFPAAGFQRYQGPLSRIMSYNLSPSLAYKITDKFSAGLGFDAMRMQTQFNVVGGLPDLAISQGRPATFYDFTGEEKTGGWGYGWHAGLLYQFTPNTRIGLNYRSQVAQKMSGTSSLTTSTGQNLQSSGFQIALRLPPTTTLSIYHAFNPQWAVMGTANYTQWSTVQSIDFYNQQGLRSIISSNPLPLKFKNTWRFAAGATYTLNPCWLFRAGIGYDQSPVNAQYQVMDVPDGNRTLFSIGTRYQVVKNVGLDLGYTYAWIKDSQINGYSQTFRINGTSRNRSSILGLQLTWDIV